MEHLCYYETKIGTIGIRENGKAITHLALAGEVEEGGATIGETPLTKRAAMEFYQYLAGVAMAFTLPMEPAGTPFQKKVWQALCAIPYGETRSYKQIAEEIGNPKACRAVGMANHRNPIMIMIPCHRVIAADGGLGGYGSGLPLKEKLLQLEKGAKKDLA